MERYLIAIGVIVFLSLAWLGVQRLWGHVFADMVHDEDVLSGRGGCSGCQCTGTCENKDLSTQKKKTK